MSDKCSRCGKVLVAYDPKCVTEVPHDEHQRLRARAERLQGERDKLAELGNRLAVLADDLQEELLAATGSADGWKVIDDWRMLRASLDQATPPTTEEECPE